MIGLELPLAWKTLIAGGALAVLGLIGKKAVETFAGSWFSRLNEAVLTVPRIAQAQTAMEESLSKRIENVRGEVVGQIALLEARTTGEDRVLAGRITAMENTVTGMEERLNSHSLRLRPIERRVGDKA